MWNGWLSWEVCNTYILFSLLKKPLSALFPLTYLWFICNKVKQDIMYVYFIVTAKDAFTLLLMLAEVIMGCKVKKIKCKNAAIVEIVISFQYLGKCF